MRTTDIARQLRELAKQIEQESVMSNTRYSKEYLDRYVSGEQIGETAEMEFDSPSSSGGSGLAGKVVFETRAVGGGDLEVRMVGLLVKSMPEHGLLLSGDSIEIPGIGVFTNVDGGLVPEDAGEGQIQLLLRLNFTVTSPHPDCVIVSSKTSRLTAIGDLSEQVDPCSVSSLLGGAFTDERAPHAPIQVTSLHPPRLEFA